MSSIAQVKQQKRTLVHQHSRPDNVKGFMQVLTTLVPFAALWYAVTPSAGVSYGLTVGVALMMSLFLLRVFVLMHECGHDSLFRSAWLNRAFGFVFGVVSGMPQYVWSKHHAYHHATNGNWDKYRGPLAIKSVAEYEALKAVQQLGYQRARNIWLAPVAGFSYVLYNPRVTWLKGSVALVAHVLKNKIAQPGVSVKAHAAAFRRLTEIPPKSTGTCSGTMPCCSARGCSRPGRSDPKCFSRCTWLARRSPEAPGSCSSAGYLEAEKRFRRIQGVRELWVLSAALGNN
jgi:omega-6 fatty acid desaturase (delta-12 desaturase)